MSNTSSKGTSMRKTISDRGQLLLAGLLVLVVAAVVLTLFVTASQPGTPAAASNAAAIRPQAVQPAQVQPNAAQAQEVPYPAGFEQQHTTTRSASPLERLYLQQQLEQDMCEGACGR